MLARPAARCDLPPSSLRHGVSSEASPLALALHSGPKEPVSCFAGRPVGRSVKLTPCLSSHLFSCFSLSLSLSFKLFLQGKNRCEGDVRSRCFQAMLSREEDWCHATPWVISFPRC